MFYSHLVLARIATIYICLSAANQLKSAPSFHRPGGPPWPCWLLKLYKTAADGYFNLKRSRFYFQKKNHQKKFIPEKFVFVRGFRKLTFVVLFQRKFSRDETRLVAVRQVLHSCWLNTAYQQHLQHTVAILSDPIWYASPYLKNYEKVGLF